MTLKLYFAPGACSFVPHALLETAGASYEPVLVKLHKQENYTPEFKALNPRSQVPVLVDGDAVITQQIAIIGYLNDKFPAAGFIPAEPLARARFMEMLAWMNNTVHSTFTHIFLPHKFLDKPELFPDLKAYNTMLYRNMLGELEAMVVAASARGHAWLAGADFGPLDAYALTLLRWGTIAGMDPAGLPALWAHVQKVAQLPAVQRVMERERLQLSLYAPAA